MGDRLTIGLGMLGKSGLGQAVVEDIVEELVCPRCGTEASNNGECLTRFESVRHPEHQDCLVLATVADCRNCGYYGPGPALKSEYDARYVEPTEIPVDWECYSSSREERMRCGSLMCPLKVKCIE